MKFTVDTYTLTQALNTVYKVIPSKPLLQLADNFAFTAHEDHITVAGTDGVTTLIATLNVPPTSQTPNKVVVHAKTLVQYISKLPDGGVTLDAGTGVLIVSSSTADQTLVLPTADASLYPDTPDINELKGQPWHKVDRDELVNAIEATQAALPDDQMNQSLEMIAIRNDISHNTAALACSGSRLHKFESPALTLPDMTISAQCHKQLRNALKASENTYVAMWVGTKAFVVHMGDVVAVFNTPAATYPDVTKALLKPTFQNEWVVTFDKHMAIDAIRRAAVTADEMTQALYVTLHENFFVVKTRNNIGATIEEAIPADWNHPTTTLVFRVKHFLDVLDAYPLGQVNLHVANPKKLDDAPVRFAAQEPNFEAVLSQLKVDFL